MKYLTLVFSAFLLCPHTVEAQGNQVESPYSWNQRHKAREVVHNYLVNSGRIGSVCQEIIDPITCKQRVNALVNAIFSSSQRHNINPWAMVALTYETTRFNPFHVDNSEFTGVIAIPLKADFRRQSQFFRNRQFRDNCQREVDACQVEIIDHAISRIAETMERRDESLARTLQRYSRENEPSERARFSRHVRRRTRNLRAAATLIEDLDICTVHRMACEH